MAFDFMSPNKCGELVDIQHVPLNTKSPYMLCFFASNQIPSPIGIRRLGLTETPFPSIASPNRYG